MTFRRAGLTVLLVAGALLVVGAGPAAASCHAFSVSASPATVNEGGTSTITVTRDGFDQPSSVRVRTRNVSSTSNDYTPIDQVVSFTGTRVSATLTLRTTEDTAVEPNEQVRIELSDGGGCSGGSPFTYDDVLVTIRNDDAAPTTTTTRPPTTTTTSSTTTSSTTSSTSSTTSSTTTTTAPSTTSTTEEEEVTTETTEAAAGEGEREVGGGSWLLPIGLSGLTVVAFAGALAARRRVLGDEGLDEVDYDPEEDE